MRSPVWRLLSLFFLAVFPTYSFALDCRAVLNETSIYNNYIKSPHNVILPSNEQFVECALTKVNGTFKSAVVHLKNDFNGFFYVNHSHHASHKVHVFYNHADHDDFNDVNDNVSSRNVYAFYNHVDLDDSSHNVYVNHDFYHVNDVFNHDNYDAHYNHNHYKASCL
ncbi:unnamed protein product [Caenorhabditis auriculariae]|uniref:Uncharacterized protein n=1 Tax=Caenorhabditis auriculariae TaxID=2777116 RepID=A0A8S1HFH4_9PELO|nr:unnamed protein product [Caenorhabditis auriculariae]